MSTNYQATPSVPISWGELLDKITILKIKESKIQNAESLSNVKNELSLLMPIVDQLKDNQDLELLTIELRGVNESLWKIEDAIRKKESMKEFDKHFIRLARSVYIKNDERAQLKKKINLKLNSRLIEEKSYHKY